MKELKNVTLYMCEFCRKKYQRKHLADWHEQHCRLNPRNRHKCFDFCIHLERYKEDISGEYNYSSEKTVFYCKALKQEMYSYIAERRNIQADGERMPLECNHYQDKSY